MRAEPSVAGAAVLRQATGTMSYRPPTAIVALSAALLVLAVATACVRQEGGEAARTETMERRTAPASDANPPSVAVAAPEVRTPARVELPRPLKAMWVHLFDNALKSQAGVDRVLDDVASAGVNAVFVQVVRRHDAYYGSQVLPRTPAGLWGRNVEATSAAARATEVRCFIRLASKLVAR